MNTNPAVAGSILRLFTIAAVVGVSGVFAADQVISIATRRRMQEAGRAELKAYNTEPRPNQDRLYGILSTSYSMASKWLKFSFRDTIFDRTMLLNSAKAAKPWNKTLAELDRSKH